MKTAKKVLSIVLAAMLILGTVPFAASALTAGQKAYISLKAEVLDATGAEEVKAYGGEAAYNSTKPTTKQKANQKVDFAEYKALEDHAYADKSKAIEVKPGQIVWVTFNLKTTGNVYPTFWATAISYTSMFYSLTNSTGCLVANAESSYLNDMEGTATTNYWGLMNTTARAKFINGTDHSYAINYDVSYGADGIADLDEDIYAVPFYVDPDATVGTTGKIYIPVKTDKVATSVSGFEDGDYSTDSYEMTGDYLDLSGAVLNFKVVGDGEELDYTALDDQIAAFEDLTEGDYTETSWAEAEEAYNAAVAAKTDATTQEDVDAAATALENAIAALVEAGPVLDYEAINEALANVPADTSNYTTSSVSALTLAKEAADTAKATATTQAELDNAATDLNNAISGLVLKADLTALNAALIDAANADTTYWTDASKEALNNAVIAGQAIVADADDFSDTEAVAAAAQAINDALAGYELEGADYALLNQYLQEAATKNESNYTEISWDLMQDAINEAELLLGKDKSFQDDVDEAADELKNRIDSLEEAIDVSALVAAVNEALTVNVEDYEDTVWATIEGLVIDSEEYTAYPRSYTKSDYQAIVDQLTSNLNAALANKLGAADYGVVDSAIANIPTDLTPYTAESVKAVTDAVAAVGERNLKSNEQDKVDALAQAINDAIAALQVRKADLNALETALSKVPADMSNYTDDSVAAVNGFKKTAEDLIAEAPDYTAQETVDGVAEDLTDAIAALTYKAANFDSIDEVITNANNLVRDNYTDESLSAFDAIIAPAFDVYNNKANYNITNQAEIDKIAEDASAAFATLVLKAANFDTIDELVNAANALVRDNYTAKSLEDFDAAFASTLEVYNNKENYNITNQADIDLIAAAGSAAFDLLELDKADYTETNKYLGQIAALIADDYTVASWNALQEVIKNTPMDLTKDKQATVDENATKLRKAKNALVTAAEGNYDAVELAKERFYALDSSNYTDDSVEAVTDAIAAVTPNLNENHQTEIDAMAKAINDAIDALVEKTYEPANYDAVNQAKAAFNDLDASLYTAESVKAVTDAIAAVKEGLDERDQDKVDAMAKAINDAIGALELLPEPEGKAVKAEYTETADYVKTFSFKVNGRAWKIQIVDANGNTITYNRVDTPEIITSYNENGEVVDDMSRDLSYEIWTVTVGLKDGQYTLITKDSYKGWETLDLGYVFNVVSSTKNVTAESVVASAETSKVGEQLPVTVTTGKDVLKIQLLVNGKEYKVFDKSCATADGDNLVFNAYVKLYTKGTNTITVKIKTAAGWTTTDLSTTVTGTVK